MTKCKRCGKEFSFWKLYNVYDKKWLCKFCVDIYKKEYREKLAREELKGIIKCPYCNEFFKPERKTPTSTEGNIVRSAAFLPWGVVSALKNVPYVECPHRHMRIMQGGKK